MIVGIKWLKQEIKEHVLTFYDPHHFMHHVVEIEFVWNSDENLTK